MGSSCCTNDQPKVKIDTEAYKNNPDWSDAVTNLKLGGVRMLHAENPDLINEPVDKFGHNAIHIAVQKQNDDLLEYLCNNGVNINAKGGDNLNTALHEAILKHDMKMVRTLFAYGIDASIPNKKNQRAIDLCPAPFKRTFLKAKQFKHKHREQLRTIGKHRTQTSEIKIAGMSLEHTATGVLNSYLKTTDHQHNFYRKKQREIEERDLALTAFGEDVGCEVDEIAMTLQKEGDPGRLWVKWAKKPELTKQTEIYKVFYGLTVMTLRKKNPRSKKPPAASIKTLTTRMCKLLPRKKGRITLQKEYFVKHCHTMLYNLHDSMVHEEMQ
eukprot:101621_1